MFVLKQLIQLSKCWWLVILLWMVAPDSARASMELRVAIASGVRGVKVGSSTLAVVRDGAGRTIGEMSAQNGLDAQSKVGEVALGAWRANQIWIEPTDGGYVWIGDRWYRGSIQIIRTTKGLTAVNHIDLEQYLYSVLGAEMNGNWPLEALKAQAVAARSYALYKRQTSGNSIYDLGNTTTWQVYKGIETETPGTHTAVDSTSRQVMTYNGKIILAVFHAASGGHTENSEEVWSSSLPYLRGVKDDDRGDLNYNWAKTFSRSELSQRLGITNIMSIIPERISTYGRIRMLKVVGARGIKHISGNQLSQLLGLKSNRFTVTSTPTAFQINGSGFGHGLGLSQWGAYNLAKEGVTYQQILTYYYQGINLTQIP